MFTKTDVLSGLFPFFNNVSHALLLYALCVHADYSTYTSPSTFYVFFFLLRFFFFYMITMDMGIWRIGVLKVFWDRLFSFYCILI